MIEKVMLLALALFMVAIALLLYRVVKGPSHARPCHCIRYNWC